MAGSGAETLYDVIQGTLVDSNLSVSVGPPLPKRQKQADTATIASPRVQEPGAITPKPEGGMSVSKEEIPAEVEPLRLNVGYTKWVYCCHVEGCPEGPSMSGVAICSYVHQAHLGTKFSCPSCPQTYLNTDDL